MNLKELEKINRRFISEHGPLNEYDIKKVTNHIKILEDLSKDTSLPHKGDILLYTSPKGRYYPLAHIDNVSKTDVYVCEKPYTPFFSVYDGQINLSTSGGAWFHLDIGKLVFVGKKAKMFTDWGHDGSCANGSVNFIAEVNVWELNENTEEFSTKTHELVHVNKMENKYKVTKDSSFFCEYKTFYSERDLLNWLDKIKAKKAKNSLINSQSYWGLKEIEKRVSVSEYESIFDFDKEEIFELSPSRKTYAKIKYYENYFVIYFTNY